jgi:hypothetical protein
VAGWRGLALLWEKCRGVVAVEEPRVEQELLVQVVLVLVMQQAMTDIEVVLVLVMQQIMMGMLVLVMQ